MFQPFICGALNHQEEDDHALWSSPNSAPRKSRRNNLCKSHNNKNPFSDRGLDKFSALVAELEEKRQKIYSQTGAQDISLVRFMYKNSTDCVPIVIKLKDRKQEEKKKSHVDAKDHQPGIMNIDSEVPMETTRLQLAREKIEKKKKKSNKWRRPSYYLPAFLVLILLLLVFFGRSASILFTCVGWYIVPTIQGESSSTKLTRSRRKKDLHGKS